MKAFLALSILSLTSSCSPLWIGERNIAGNPQFIPELEKVGVELMNEEF